MAGSSGFGAVFIRLWVFGKSGFDADLQTALGFEANGGCGLSCSPQGVLRGLHTASGGGQGVAGSKADGTIRRQRSVGGELQCRDSGAAGIAVGGGVGSTRADWMGRPGGKVRRTESIVGRWHAVAVLVWCGLRC